MPAKFNADTCTINWHGTDDTTPPGHTIATGTDSLGSIWLWLFKGDQATDDAYVGAVSIPRDPGSTQVAYGRRGGFVGTVTDTRDSLAKLAAVGDNRNTVLDEAIEAARGEYLHDDTGTPEDEAYNQAVSDVVAAIDAIRSVDTGQQEQQKGQQP